MNIEPKQEHLWLQRMLGEWSFEAEVRMTPDQTPSKSNGTESVRSLGGLWILAEGQMSMPDCGPTTTMMTLGYDPDKKRCLGTFIGTMMTHMWVYDGAFDAAGNVLTLDTEGPSMSGDGKMAKYQDVIEFKSADHRILSSQLLGDDGQWKRFMTSHYRRR